MTPARLAVRLLIYFGCVVGGLAAIVQFTDWSQYLPLGGGYELAVPGSAEELIETLETVDTERAALVRFEAALALTGSLAGTVVLMIPITWVFMATRFKVGFTKAFVAALIVLPICATSIVLLIQDSLALAFGLAALVAAVRFRVQLRDALEGIYVFAAICVGLASGVGYFGVAFVMAVFFCFALVILWGLDYGTNPVEEARQQRKRAKLEQPLERIGSPQ